MKNRYLIISIIAIISLTVFSAGESKHTGGDDHRTPLKAQLIRYEARPLNIYPNVAAAAARAIARQEKAEKYLSDVLFLNKEYKRLHPIPKKYIHSNSGSSGTRKEWNYNQHATGSCAIPQYICDRESGGNIRAKNPSSSASGKYQFLDSTWGGYGGYQHASDAPEWMQDARAREVWAETNGSAWACC